MNYRKYKADRLFTGRDWAEPGTVLVMTEEGIVRELVSGEDAGEEIIHLPGILSPGFVNCHCHLELSHMKGVLPERTGLVDFLLAVMRQRGGGPAAAERVQQAIADAEDGMLREGIVAVGDICNTADTLVRKKEGNLLYHNFIETMGFVEQTAKDRFEQGLKVFNEFAEAYSMPVEANSLVPHAPYSVSAPLFDLIAGFPGNHILSIHNQEDEAENDFYMDGKGDFTRLYATMGLDTSFFSGRGKRSLESYLGHFYHNQQLILVHNVATTARDLDQALNWRGKGSVIPVDGPAEGAGGQPAGGRGLFFCLCPNANLYISGRLPDPWLLLERGCQIVVGTDSLASNHQLSIMAELKTLQEHFPDLPTTTLLGWATLNGARALQLDNIAGSLEPGRQPGLVWINNMAGDKFTKQSEARRIL